MNTDDTKQDVSRPQGNAYPLLALFFIVAAFAIVVAILAPTVALVQDDAISKGNFVVSSVIVGIVGMVLGFFIGLYHYRRMRGAGWGVLSGMFVGALVGPVYLSPNYHQVTATCLGGSLLLIVLGAACRIFDRSGES